jgi:phosphonopyruvate decarboxylase
MIDAKKFIKELKKIEIDFFCGVPDSLMSEFSKSLHFDFDDENHIISTNEGGAISTAMGYYLSSGKTPLIYMQNSGLGNFINPFTSLLNKEIYDIPFLLLIGWRGEPSIKDEPQHIFQGKITLSLLELLEIDYLVIDSNSKVNDIIEKIEKAKFNGKQLALVIRKNTFKKDKRIFEVNNHLPKRKDALKAIVEIFGTDSIFISTTGKLSRELYELRKESKKEHDDLYVVGGMGHASSISLGILQNIKSKNVVCLDGDGSLLMHLGSLGLFGEKSYKNFYHIVFNNSSHESVGGQPNIYKNLDTDKLYKSLGYKSFSKLSKLDDLENIQLNEIDRPALIEIAVQNSSSGNLIRPETSPINNKIKFMKKLKLS